MNALIIDDNEMTRTLLRAILTGSGHKVMAEAGSGKQGLEQTIRLKPDIVFLDIQMPDCSGLEVLRKIRSQLSKTMVMMVTGKRDAEKECLANGASGVIIKPFKSDQVLKTLHRVASLPISHAPFQPVQQKTLRREYLPRLSLASTSIRMRLFGGFAGVMLLTVLAGVAGNWGLHIARNATNQLVDQTFAKERLISEWRSETNLNGSRILAMARNIDPNEQELMTPKLKETTAHISTIQKQLEAFPKDEIEKSLYDVIDKRRSDYLAARDELLTAKKNGQDDRARSLAESQLEPALNSYVASIRDLSNFEEQAMKNSTIDVGAQFSKGENILNALVLFALLLSAGAAYVISLSITRPLQVAINISKAVSNGDLTTTGIHVDGTDELSELLWGLKHMTENLGVLVGQVRSGADKIAVAAGHIATGSMNLSTRTEQQASSLEETASTMEELTSTVKQNAENAKQASALADSASTVAIKGGTVVSQVVETMGSINSSSRKIADIIGVIDGIAFQTNILALNAAVEAARAGEQGRGFAVVAAEVRNLAQRSAAAAKEIKALIDDSVASVSEGAKLVDHAGDTMKEIVASIRKVSDIVGEISLASGEQSSGIEQIGDSIVELDKMTQQNSILVDSSLDAAQNMEDQAREMVAVVKEFKLDQSQGNINKLANQPDKLESRGTPKEAISLVHKALDFRKTCSSKDAFLRGITNHPKDFSDRDMYVFALDKNGKYLAFAGNQSKVGSRVHDIAGIDGQALMNAIVRQCTEGPGWVNYDILNTTTNKVQSKMSFVEPVDGAFVGCGVYTSLD